METMVEQFVGASRGAAEYAHCPQCGRSLAPGELLCRRVDMGAPVDEDGGPYFRVSDVYVGCAACVAGYEAALKEAGAL